jgi:hypothetical protein
MRRPVRERRRAKEEVRGRIDVRLSFDPMLLEHNVRVLWDRFSGEHVASAGSLR